MPPVFYWLGEYLEMGWRWFSMQYWIWWAYFKTRAWRFWKLLWNLFSIYAVAIFVVTAILTLWAYLRDQNMPPEKLSVLSSVTNIMFAWLALGGGAIVFALIFVVFIVLSSFPRGRDIADKNLKFAKPTEAERLKDETEGRLAALEKFKADTEKRLSVSGKSSARVKKKVGKHKGQRR
jgi:hypothetical protein